ncbi:MAG TPA: glycosyltransferase family 39 protein [Chitinophagaceae bacterium]|nr:glycosyltransferase family 39 protein [Chitinophagaceae bacterium]
MKKQIPFWPIIIALAVFKFFLPFLLQSPVYELQRDEYLYYQQGQHFDFGYLENPPLLSYLAMITSAFGNPVFWIKFWPSLFGSLTVIVSCLIAAEFGGKRFAQFITGLCISTGAFVRVHSLFQPNILDIFFWTLAIYYIIRYINADQKKFLWLFCFSLALGFWGKYSVVFIAAALILSLLISRHRKLFTEKKFYLVAFIAFLFILPNILWQYFHNWPLVHHMQELQETQLRFLNPMDFIKDQILFLIPVIFVWITGLAWLFKNRQWRFLFFTYFLVIIFLLLGRGKSYYSLGVYPMLLAAGAVSLEKWSAAKQWFRYAMPVLIIALTLPFIPLLLPVWKPDKLAAFYKSYGIDKTGLLKWEDRRDHQLPQDFADMLGWKELAGKTEQFFSVLPDSTKANTVIYCRNYGQAGALKFYGRSEYFTGKVISDNGSFLLWVPERLEFRHLLFIGRRMPGSDDEVFQHFQSAMIIDSVTNIYSRQSGDKIIFFQNADDEAWPIANKILNEKKSQFSR